MCIYNCFLNMRHPLYYNQKNLVFLYSIVIHTSKPFVQQNAHNTYMVYSVH